MHSAFIRNPKNFLVEKFKPTCAISFTAVYMCAWIGIWNIQFGFMCVFVYTGRCNRTVKPIYNYTLLRCKMFCTKLLTVEQFELWFGWESITHNFIVEIVKMAKSKKSGPVVKCKICSKEFLVQNISTHLKNHGRTRHFQCKICVNKFFKTNNAFKNHNRKCHTTNTSDIRTKSKLSKGEHFFLNIQSFLFDFYLVSSIFFIIHYSLLKMRSGKKWCNSVCPARRTEKGGRNSPMHQMFSNIPISFF